MSKKRKVASHLLSLVLLSASVAAKAEFVTGMSRDQANTEIGAQLNAGMSLGQIAKDAQAAGLNSVLVTELLIKAGQSSVAVVEAVVTSNPAVAEAVTSLAIKMSPAGQAGEIAAVAVTAALNQAAAITNAAIAAAPAQRNAIIAAVLTVPGVNPDAILVATAAGANTIPAPAAVNLPNATPVVGGGGSASPA